MFNTSVMKCNGTRQFRGTIQNSLIPDLTHSSCIDKNECRLAVVNDGNYLIDQLNSQMTRPGKFFYLIWKDGFDLHFLLHFGCDNNAVLSPLLWRGARGEVYW